MVGDLESHFLFVCLFVYYLTINYIITAQNCAPAHLTMLTSTVAQVWPSAWMDNQINYFLSASCLWRQCLYHLPTVTQVWPSAWIGPFVFPNLFLCHWGHLPFPTPCSHQGCSFYISSYPLLCFWKIICFYTAARWWSWKSFCHTLPANLSIAPEDYLTRFHLLVSLPVHHKWFYSTLFFVFDMTTPPLLSPRFDLTPNNHLAHCHSGLT